MKQRYNHQFTEDEVEIQSKTRAALAKAKAATQDYKLVRIDSKTAIFIAPDRNEAEARRKFLSRQIRKVKIND